MNRFRMSFFMLLCIFALSFNARATHSAGGELVYEWVSDSTYRFYFKFYRLCETFPTAASFSMCYFSPCDGRSGGVRLDSMRYLPNGERNGQEINPGCPGTLTRCTDPNSPLPGFKEFWYTGLVTLRSRCENWTFYVTINARNPSDNLQVFTSGGTVPNEFMYIEATLNNKDAQRFASPYFTVKPIPYVCLNTPSRFSSGPVDPDGDVLSYEFITPRGQNASCYNTYSAADLNYIPPFNITNPFATNNTFQFDVATQLMRFTPSALSSNTVATRVTKTRNNVVLGTVMRDIQFQVIACQVAPADLKIIPSSITGATYTNDRFEVCADSRFRFCFNINTALKNSTLVVTDNHEQTTPGSILTYTNQLTDSVIGCFTWTPQDTGLKLLTITVKDSTCRAPGVVVPQTFIIPIYVKPVFKDTRRTVASICQGDSVNLTASGDRQIKWSVMPGGDDTGSLSCLTCKNTVARPSSTTTYVASFNTLNTCTRGDTLKVIVTEIGVNIAPDGPIVSCRPDTLSFSATATGARPYAIAECGAGQMPLTSPLTNTEVNLQTFSGLQQTANAVSSPFNGAYLTARHQYLIKAQDMHMSGIPAGTLKSISFKTSNTVGSATFENLKVSLKCTTDPLDVSGNFDNTAILVYSAVGAATFSTNTGWITIDFDNLYNWNGTQDLLVDICYANTATTPGIFTAFYTTSYDAMLGGFNTTGNVCNTASYLGGTILARQLPLMRFAYYTSPEKNFSYNWQGGVFVPDTAAATVKVPVERSMTVTAAAHGRNGCIAKDSVAVFMPQHRYRITPDTAICYGESVALHITDDLHFGNQTLQWYEDGYVAAASLDCNTCSTPVAKPLQSTRYTVVILDSVNCADTQHVYVRVKPIPQVRIENQDTLIGLGESVSLSAIGAERYIWFPVSTLNNPNIPNPAVTPEFSTVYSVIGIAEGCQATDSVLVSVDREGNLFIPSAFTPNGDGKNDLFKVVNITFQKVVEFRVYNRWGQEVFNTTNSRGGWNGTWKGVSQDMGTYHYLIRVVIAGDDIRTFKGNVTLIR